MIVVKYCDNNIRIIEGIVLDYHNKPICNATVVLSVRYCSICYYGHTEKIGYTTSDIDGRFAFSIDISCYDKCEFILETFNPLIKIF